MSDPPARPPAFNVAASAFVPVAQRGALHPPDDQPPFRPQGRAGAYFAPPRATPGPYPVHVGAQGMGSYYAAAMRSRSPPVPVSAPSYQPTATPATAAITPGRRAVHSFFLNDQLRAHLHKRNALLLKGTSMDAGNYPPRVGQYHSFYALEGHARPSAVFNVPSVVLKATHLRDGLCYALRKCDTALRGNAEYAMQVVEAWKAVQHSGVVTLREVFRSAHFDLTKQTSSVVFVYDFHPLAETLDSRFLRPGVPFIPEDVLWSMVAQLCAAVQCVHRHRLHCNKMLTPSKILITNKNRVRINCAGMEDVLQADPPRPLLQAQYQDLLLLGRLIVMLACRSKDAVTHFAKSMEVVTNNYSPALKDLIIALSNKHTSVFPSINEVCALVNAQFVEQCDRLFIHCDHLEAELAREVDNGRLFRLVAKLGFINERPDYDQASGWSETGDRYLLKLFRDYVFHQIDERQQPVIDLAHVVECLNKLDVGSPEKILLMSRNEKTMLVVTYADVRRLVDEAYAELTQAPGAMLYSQ